MARFLEELDYSMQIKQEIIKLITTEDWFNSAMLIRAENTALSQIRNRIGKLYDCDLIFAPNLPPAEVEEGEEGEQLDSRDAWIITIVIDMCLYHLYAKLNARDIPEHRSTRYQDAIDWLKDVGNGTTTAELPIKTDFQTGEEYSEVRINSREPENHRY